MNYSFELKDLLANYRNAVESKQTRLNDYVKAIKEQIIADPTDLENKLKDYEEAQYRYANFYNEYCDRQLNKHLDYITAGYNMFDNIARGLNWEVKVEVINDKIIFNSFGSLSLTALMLSKYFGFHSSMFSFSNGFSSHDAYTDDKNYGFTIGYNEDANGNRDGRVCIDFGLMKYLDKNLNVGY